MTEYFSKLRVNHLKKDLLINNLVEKEKFVMSIPQFYFAVNLWVIVYVLSLFWVPMLASNERMIIEFQSGMRCIWFSTCDCSVLSGPDVSNCRIGISWIWIAIIFQAISNNFTTKLSREDSATFSTMILSLAPALSTLIIGIHALFGQYYSAINWTGWLSFFLVAFGVVIYKIPSMPCSKKSVQQFN
eukprot:TRINITY_DN12666_c0_g1_i1.p1 TRINITY_DN12666_c0_g1~~TRINITY_DN12666_c0_g1_i1.p1  ORF type:complete len:187 (-),score=17.22 TRINITY_DN12666_c0_g1_i1:71-631(-)